MHHAIKRGGGTADFEAPQPCTKLRSIRTLRVAWINDLTAVSQEGTTDHSASCSQARSS